MTDQLTEPSSVVVPVLARRDSRIIQAMRLLERDIAGRPDYRAIAHAIGLSHHHFYHLFADETGETPGDYLRRIRLEAAAERLRWTRERVGDIATSVGYASQPSFNKAFERRFGMRPVAFRRDRVRFPSEPTASVPDKQVRMIDSAGLRLLARRYVGAPCFVPDYWANFLTTLPEELSAPGAHLYVGILRDDMRFTPPEQCRYDCCIAIGETIADTDIGEAWSELSPVMLTPGLCATIRYCGYYAASDAPDEGQSISHAYSYLLDTWLTQSRYTFVGDYAAEVYAVPPSRCAPQDLECTIMVQVR